MFCLLDDERKREDARDDHEEKRTGAICPCKRASRQVASRGGAASGAASGAARGAAARSAVCVAARGRFEAQLINFVEAHSRVNRCREAIILTRLDNPHSNFGFATIQELVLAFGVAKIAVGV